MGGRTVGFFPAVSVAIEFEIHETKKSQIIRPEHQNHRITCTEHKEGAPPSTAARPRSDLRPHATAESVFNGGDAAGYSPGPMTLLSSLFGNGDEYKSFSEFLAGAMMDPTPPRFFPDSPSQVFLSMALRKLSLKFIEWGWSSFWGNLYMMEITTIRQKH
ncbi:hypothetical protein V8G54_001726 [Vigna mungo]|uniref:Uncharacterized protein n=1 Tax=Vigna mungo TaxID=3915 RepID=A0AAQ3P9Y8_VIGMU